MIGDAAPVRLIDQFLDGQLGIAAFEREFLRAFKQSPIEMPEMQGPLGRAFHAVEAYDPSVTSDSETVHNTTYETMLSELRSARGEMRSIHPEVINRQSSRPALVPARAGRQGRPFPGITPWWEGERGPVEALLAFDLPGRCRMLWLRGQQCAGRRGRRVVDDEDLQHPGVDPLEMAAHDQAAADKYQELADAELALRDGLRLNARLLSTQGFDEAAEKARGSANLADTIEDHAESGNTVYLHAANAWTTVAEDQTDEARRADQATAEKFDEVGRKVDGWIAPYERQQKE